MYIYIIYKYIYIYKYIFIYILIYVLYIQSKHTHDLFKKAQKILSLNSFSSNFNLFSIDLLKH